MQVAFFVFICVFFKGKMQRVFFRVPLSNIEQNRPRNVPNSVFFVSNHVLFAFTYFQKCCINHNSLPSPFYGISNSAVILGP